MGFFDSVSSAASDAADAVGDAVSSVTGGGDSGGGSSSSGGSSGSSRSSSSSRGGRRSSSRSSGGGSSGGGGSSRSSEGGTSSGGSSGRGGFFDDVGDTAGEFYSDAKRTVDDTVAGAQRTADKTVSKTQNAIDTATRTVTGSSGGGGGGFVGDAREAIDEGREFVEDTTDDVTSGVQSTADDVVSETQDAIDTATRTVTGSSDGGGGGFVGDARKAIDEGREFVEDTTDKQVDQATQAAKNKIDQGRDFIEQTSDEFISEAEKQVKQTQRTANDAYQATASAGDHLAGSTDEAVARATDAAQEGDVAGVADNLAGTTDEAVFRATEAARRGDAAGVGDALAGRVDETVGPPAATAGDFFAGSYDEATNRAIESARRGDWAGVGDALAGRYDEATGAIVGGTAATAAGARVGIERAFDAARRGDFAGTGDALAGSFDEEVGRTVDTYDAAFDVLAGSTDEATNRAIESARRGDLGGVGDALSGDADEAVNRAIEAARRGDLAGAGDNLAGGLDETVGGAVDAYPTYLDFYAGSTDEAVNRAIEASRRGDTVEAYDHLYGGLDEGVAGITKAGERATEELGEGDVAGALDEAAGRTDESFDRIARGFLGTETAVEYGALLGDELLGHLDEEFGRSTFPKQTTTAVTSKGGFLTESQESTLKEASREFSDDVEATQDLTEGFVETFDTPGGVVPKGARGAAGILGAGNIFAAAGAGETGAEIAQNLSDSNAQTVAQAGAALGGAATYGIYDDVTTNPFQTAGEVLAGFGVGYGAVKGLKKVGNSVRYADKTYVDPEDLVNENTLDYYEGRSSDPSAEFPSFQQQQGETLVDTFRRQGEDYTPEEIQEKLGETTQTQTYAKHTTDHSFDEAFEAGVEKSRKSDPTDAMFFSTELSANFARLSGGNLEALQPRLPRFGDIIGDRGETILTRIDIDKAPDDVPNEKYTGESLWAPGGESKWLAEEAEEGIAYVRSPANTNLGEAEAIVKGGTVFEELPGSGQYYTVVDDTPIDLRFFEPTDRPDVDIDATELPDDVDGSRRYGDIDDPGLADDADEIKPGQMVVGNRLPDDRYYPTDSGTPVAPNPGMVPGRGSSATSSPDRATSELERTFNSLYDDRASDPFRYRRDRPRDRGRSETVVSRSDSDSESPTYPGGYGSSGGSSPARSDPYTPPSSSPSSPASQPPSSPPSEPPSAPPSSPPSVPPSSPYTPGSGSSPVSPVFDPGPGPGTTRQVDYEEEPDREEDELPPVSPFDIPFSNPIASGQNVLASLFGGYSTQEPMVEPPDETGGYQL